MCCTPLSPVVYANCPDCGAYVGNNTTTPPHQPQGSREACSGVGKPTV